MLSLASPKKWEKSTSVRDKTYQLHRSRERDCDKIFLKRRPDIHLCPPPYLTGLDLGFIHKARPQHRASYSDSCGWRGELSSNCQSRTCPPAQQRIRTSAYVLCRVCAAQALGIQEDMKIFCHCCYQRIQQQKAWMNAQDCLATARKSQNHFYHTWISSLPERGKQEEDVPKNIWPCSSATFRNMRRQRTCSNMCFQTLRTQQTLHRVTKTSLLPSFGWTHLMQSAECTGNSHLFSPFNLLFYVSIPRTGESWLINSPVANSRYPWLSRGAAGC